MGSCQDDSIGRQIYRTSLELRNYAEKMLGPYGLTVEQFHLMKNISVAQGMSQNDLCQVLLKKPANITRILDRLEKKDWVERRPNPQDRRSSLVYLTEEGEKIRQSVSTKFDSYSSWFIAGIEPEEERIFRRVLLKIDDNLRRMMDEIDS